MDTAGTWTARAFAPAHLTGFFEVHREHANPYRQGSRGAGLNLQLGVTATVTLTAPGQGMTFLINGKEAEAATAADALGGLLGKDYPGHVRVAFESELPAQQGFGVSGGGALSAGLAVAHLLGFPQKNAVWEAHRAEVEHKTGLGDVAGQSLGGAEIRVTPGPPPMGVVQRFAGREIPRYEVLCCVLARPLSTAAVLGDPEKVARINAAGGDAVERLRADPRLERYMELSAAFSDRLGLIDDELAAALHTARRFGPATQTMLGNSLHLLLDTERPGFDPVAAFDALSAHGRVFQTKITGRGAHVLE